MSDHLGYPLITRAQTLVADASVAHTVTDPPTKAEAEAALNALGVKINAVLDILETHGLMKAS